MITATAFSAAATPTGSTQPPVVALNAGGAAVTVSGTTYSADAYATGGSVSTRAAKTGTADEALYADFRVGVQSYSIPVPNGQYDVTLKTAENYWTSTGKRVFDVSLEGSKVLSSFDPFSAAGGFGLAADRTFTTTVTDGKVDMAFSALKDKAIVAGLVIRPHITEVGASINAGGAAVTVSGTTYSADAYATGGSVSTRAAKTGTADEALYADFRVGVQSYSIPVPNGQYDVTLKTAENYWTSIGKRVFDVSLEGSKVLRSFDPFFSAGGLGLAADRTFTTTVTDGKVDMAFSALKDKAIVAAVLIKPHVAAAVAGGAAVTAPSAFEPLEGIFGASSVWKQDISTAPQAANSAPMVSRLAQEVAGSYNGVAAFNVNQYNTSIYTVPASQPRVDVQWSNCQNRTTVPPGLLGPGGQFTQVPVPADAVPATGTDAQLTIYSPETNQLWEFWR
ncbi:malectin domain-containing carbohydrate-binding protein, partial [Kineococcus auxinigenes]|uniref:malectin domain-containing carbohydrate-binding protein n=1 Tax=unclassified Kineococcus TaxID=2621656 RepID=UPI003D7D911F